MDRAQNMLLDVWREACRHIEIDRSVEAIARLLAHRIPIDCLGVWSFDWERNQAKLQAVGLGSPDRITRSASKSLQVSEKRLLQTWARSQKVLVAHPQNPVCDELALLIGKDLEASWMAVPLSGEQGTIGALVLRAQHPATFGNDHFKIAASLMEPFSVAMENDRRLHELNALREAAEADKRSVLSRLGRDELVDTIVGGEGGLKPVLERVAQVAKSDIPVLILGETGSGKEIIARAIHEQSPRSKGAFIRVNCGAIPPELIDSELFGHVRGAFTGATSERKGWFERADEGTLLLDEIGDLPLPAQVRFLRVLQEGVFERVGGERPVRVRVRIVAATHRDLPAMVQDGRFREDLWYRIAGFPIVLPPLRERKGDIPALAEHFALRAAKRFGIRPQYPTPEDMQLLEAYDWPGNIRELASVLDRAAILGDGRRLEVAKALGGTQNQQPGLRPAPTHSIRNAPQQTIATLNENMKAHIEAALLMTRGKIEGATGAAKLLGINPHTLRARMRKLRVNWSEFRAQP